MTSKRSLDLYSAAMADAVGVSAAIKRGEVSALGMTEKAKDYSYSSRYLIPDLDLSEDFSASVNPANSPQQSTAP